MRFLIRDSWRACDSATCLAYCAYEVAAVGLAENARKRVTALLCKRRRTPETETQKR